jgi:hypothetical protein
MTFRFNSESKVKTQTVQNILDAYEVRGYSGSIDPETPIQFEGDVVGYAVKIQGFYTRAELIAIVEDLWAFNQSTPK